MASVVDELTAQILKNTNAISVLTELVTGLTTTVQSTATVLANYKLTALAFFCVTIASFFFSCGMILIILDKIGVINFYREGLRIRVSTVMKGEMVEVIRKEKVKEKKVKKEKVKKVKKEKVKKEKSSHSNKKKKVNDKMRWEKIKGELGGEVNDKRNNI